MSIVLISTVALEQSVLRKGLKAKRTEMSVKSLSVFSKFGLFFEMFKMKVIECFFRCFSKLVKSAI